MKTDSLEPFVSSLIALTLISAAIYGIGRVLHRQIGKDDPRRRRQGEFIPQWVAGAYAALGIGTLCWFGPDRDATMAAGELAACGILLGLVLGWVHGSIRVRLKPRRVARAEPAWQEDGNPYHPPSITMDGDDLRQ